MRNFPSWLRFWTALLLVTYLSVIHIGPVAAGIAPSRMSGVTAIVSTRDVDMLLAQRALENKIVAQKLRDYGVSPENAQLRLATLSDQDLHTLATASKGLPSGGDGGAALVTILVVILLVLLILKLMNKDVVVK